MDLESVATYNPVTTFLQRHWSSRQLVRWGGTVEGGRVLDLGCGRGVSTRLIADRLRPADIHAFDIDGDAVRRARRRLDGRVPTVTRIFEGSATAIDEPDGSFDAVFESFVIHNVPQWRAAVAEVRRVLKPGGRFYFGEHTRQALDRRWVSLLFDHDEAGFFSPEEWFAELRAHGMEVGDRWRVRLGGLVMLGVAQVDRESVALDGNGTMSKEDADEMQTSPKSDRSSWIGAVEVRAEVPMPLGTRHATTFISFTQLDGHEEHFLVRFGDPVGDPLVRIHSQCITGDLFGSLRCDCGPQLRAAIDDLDEHGGYLVYLRQEGRGIGLYSKLDAYVLQDAGFDTYEANRHLDFAEDGRSYVDAARMLLAVGVDRVRLITNNPDKVAQLRAAGLEVVDVVPTGAFVNHVNERYLAAKVERGHLIDLALRTEQP